MIIPRASVRRVARLINQPSSTVRRRLLQQVRRQAYSSGGAHETTQASSDLPWAIGAVVVTVPSVSYILWPKPKDNDHGHGHGGHEEHESNEGHAADKDGTEKDEEDAEGGGVQNEQSQGDGSPEVSEVGEESWVTEEERSHEAGGISKDEESADESSSEGGQGQDTPASSDDDQTSSVSDGDAATEGQKEPQFKGPAEDGPPSDSRTSYSDSKGFKKKRIESSYGNPQGSVEGKDAMDPDSDGITDKAAAAKPVGSQNTMSGKQQGLSNTDTKHSTDILADPNKSKKPEGQPETAKLKGTVDPKRGQD